MTKLNARALSGLPETLAVPRYDRTELTTGIVHFGVGGFHRAHQAMYLDRLMNDGQGPGLGHLRGGRAAPRRAMKQVMDAQDCLYTLVLKNPDGTREGRVIGSINEYLFAPEDPEAVIEKMAVRGSPHRLAHRHRGRIQLPPRHRRIRRRQPGRRARPGAGSCARGQRSAWSPRPWPGGANAGLAPFTVMSCDNIQGNGDVARKMFTAFATLKDPSSGPGWIGETCPFPNSMVDRITPVTTDADRAAIADEFGVEDAWPVVCEPFAQWVLEDHFSRGPAGVRRRGRAAGGRCGALRADEAPAAQRQPPGPVLLRATSPATATRTRSARTRCSSGSCWTTWTWRPRPRWRPLPGVTCRSTKER